MNDFDDLDKLLAPPAQNLELRGRLRMETSRFVRRQKWGRRIASASALAACYVAGLLAIGAVWQYAAGAGAAPVVIVKEPAEVASEAEARRYSGRRTLELAAEQADGAESTSSFSKRVEVMDAISTTGRRRCAVIATLSI